MEINMDQVISVEHSTVGEAEDRGKKKVPIVFEAGVLVQVENTCLRSYLFIGAEVGSSSQQAIQNLKVC